MAVIFPLAHRASAILAGEVRALQADRPAAGAVGTPPERSNAQPKSAEKPHADDEIVVTAPSTHSVSNYLPLLKLNRMGVASLGASSMAQLLERLEFASRSSDGQAAVVLLNGKRVASQDDVLLLPPEAVASVEVLPEPAAAQFGYSPTVRVINITTLPRFTSVVGEASLDKALGSGGSDRNASVSATVLRGDLRAAATATGRSRRPPTFSGSARLTVPADQFLATPPSLRSFDVSGTVAGPIATDINGSFSASVTGDRSLYSRNADQSDQSPASEGLRQPRVANLTRKLDASAQWFVSQWTWQARWTGTAGRTVQLEAEPQAGGSNGRTSSNQYSLSANGRMASLPAGELSAAFVVRSLFETASTRNGDQTASTLRRQRLESQFSLSAPLTRPPVGGLNVSASLEPFRSANVGAGLDWSATVSVRPNGEFALSATAARRETAPDLRAVAAPIFVRRGVTYFDPISGTDAVVDVTEGGNSGLRPERSRELTLNAEFQATPNLRISASYATSDRYGTTARFGAATADLERAFPDRYSRDQAGRLRAVSLVPVNLHRLQQQTLSLGASFNRGPGSGDLAASKSPTFLIATVDATIRLKDLAFLVPGARPLNVLSGTTLEGDRSRARIEIGALVTLTSAALGGNLSTRWRSPMRQRGTPADPVLMFREPLDVTAGVFMGLDTVLPGSWARGFRAEVSVSNLLGLRPNVRGSDGPLPPSLRPDAVDPRGRSVSVSLRKAF